MSRDSSGTYTLPAGNPVVNATTVTTAWGNNTLNDLTTEMTDSLSRSGKGGMTAAFKLADGTVGAPAFSFTSEVTTGIYRAAAADMRVAVSGADVLKISTASKLQVWDGAAFQAVPYNSVTDRLLGRDTAATGALEAITVGGGIEFTGSAGIQTSAFTGNVTKAAGGTATTIATDAVVTSNILDLNVTTSKLAANAVTTAKIATNNITTALILDANVTLAKVVSIATASILGRTTGGTGVPEVLTGAQALAITAGAAAAQQVIAGAGMTGGGTLAADRTLDVVATSGGGLTVNANDVQVNRGHTETTGGVGYLGVPVVTQTGAYTTISTDAGKAILYTSGHGAGDIVTIAANASVAYAIGTVLTFINADATNTVGIAINTDTMTMAGTADTGPFTLGVMGIATAFKMTATTWIVSGSVT